MSDDWGEPIEPRAPIKIDAEGCVVVGKYTGVIAEVEQKRDTDRKSKIHGVLLEVGTALVGKGIPEGYVWDSGDECRFWGSFDLDDKLRLVPVGSRVRIAYTGNDSLSGGRTMKRFEVRTSKVNGD